MKVALLGAGRIGRLHGRLAGGDARRRRRRHRRCRPGARRRGRGRGGRHRRPDHRGRHGRRRRRRHRRRHDRPRRADPRLDRPRPADLLREAARGRPRRHARGRRRDRAQRRPVPARLPAAVRPRLPRGAPAGRDRRARDALRGAPRRSRPRAAARVVHPAVRRPVPRFLHPRLRYPALADRLRGGGGLCRWGRPGLPGVREVRRRRHGRRDAAHDRRTVRDPDLGAPRPARLRHPGGAVRLGRQRVASASGPRTPLRSVEPGVPPPAGPAWADFIDRFTPAYAAEFTAFIRVARGEVPSPCTARDGVAALRIAEAATRSLHEHRPVRLEEIPG